MKHYSNHIAVWMDHHQAHLVYQKNKDEYAVETMESNHDLHPRIDGEDATISTGEYKKHNVEKNQLHEYYQELKKVLGKYDEILLFGPTTAKDELFNLLFEDKSFNGKRITTEHSDKMTEHQMIAYAKEYFENTIA
jgi:type IV secretory pathway VirD2 relaxase